MSVLKNLEEPNIWIQDKLTLFLFPQLKSVNLELLKKYNVKYAGLSVGSSQMYSISKNSALQDVSKPWHAGIWRNKMTVKPHLH